MLGTPKKLLVGLLLVAGLGACGDGGSESATRAASSPSSTSGAATEVGPGDAGYTPVSNVDPHAAIGDDIARIKELLAPAKQGAAVDWTGVKAVWEEGEASKKGDGSTRTLRKLVDDPDTVASVDGAIAGSAGGASGEVRAQQVDKGISVLLAAKVIEELQGAAEKVAAGKTDPAAGAPHNVDEAWAFFTAKGNGLASTAEKRAADFKRDGSVAEPILAALRRAQAAASKGDSAGLTDATGEVRQGINYVFYLATHKYLGASDDAGRAEGRTFYRAIQPFVAAADAAADQAIVAGFASGDAASARAALHRGSVLKALAIAPSQRVDT